MSSTIHSLKKALKIARKNGWRGREKYLEEKLREMELRMITK